MLTEDQKSRNLSWLYDVELQYVNAREPYALYHAIHHMLGHLGMDDYDSTYPVPLLVDCRAPKED